jgi:hypothetical protein
MGTFAHSGGRWRGLKAWLRARRNAGNCYDPGAMDTPGNAVGWKYLLRKWAPIVKKKRFNKLFNYNDLVYYPSGGND